MTIRILHHWACSGGTILSRAIASLPQVVVLSEVHPLAHLRLETPKRDYTPTDLIQQLCLPHNGRDPALCVAAWNGAIDALQAVLDSENRHLVLRSHSHIDFFTGASTAEEPFVSRSLAPRHRLLELVSVRHPLDSWISLQAQGWDRHFFCPSLAEFCRRGLLMLEACTAMPMLRYETFCLSPDTTLHQICTILDLPHPNGAATSTQPVAPDECSGQRPLASISLSGDSGRSSDQIGPRPRRPIPDAVRTDVEAELQCAEANSPYQSLCAKLGYNPDPSAGHPFTLAPWSPLDPPLFLHP